ncbi:MAG: hypothetical protein ACKOYG_07570 [Ilumatobacteraceae bacterium]
MARAIVLVVGSPVAHVGHGVVTVSGEGLVSGTGSVVVVPAGMISVDVGATVTTLPSLSTITVLSMITVVGVPVHVASVGLVLLGVMPSVGGTVSGPMAHSVVGGTSSQPVSPAAGATSAPWPRTAPDA